MYNNDSYKSHEENIVKMVGNTDFEAFRRSYFSEGLTTSWLVQLTNNNLDPILDSDPGTSWLTIGDGRYGSDAYYLLQKGFKVMATDISDAALKIGAEKGFIKDYHKENAEHLSFADKVFDYSLCKEALHHFPRPFAAIYEMLRVSRKGIVLIEPCDMYVFSTSRQIFFRRLIEKLSHIGFFRKILGDVKRHTYEDAGNYVYKISRRELEKVALGLNLQYIAFKDFSIPTDRSDNESNGPEERVGPKASRYIKKKRKIRIFDALVKFKLTQPSNICAIIFTECPSQKTIESLRKDSYDFIELPANPYSKSK
jgi:ubiquinone/menaquinone biosynthesis C-methylase UbiE